jgi:hypothetical protein
MIWKLAGHKVLGMSGRSIATGFASLLVYLRFNRQFHAVFYLQSQSPLAAGLMSANHRFSLAQKGCNDPELHDVAVKDGLGTQFSVSDLFPTGQNENDQAHGVSLSAQDTYISNAPAAIPPAPGIHLECRYHGPQLGRKRKSVDTFNHPKLIQFERLLRTVANAFGASMTDPMEYVGQPAIPINVSKASDRFNLQE